MRMRKQITFEPSKFKLNLEIQFICFLIVLLTNLVDKTVKNTNTNNLRKV